MTRSRPLATVLLIAFVLAIAATTPPAAMAYVEGFYNSTRGHAQWTDYYCVAANAEAELDYVNSTTADTTSQTQDEYYGYGRSKDKLDYGSTAGVDPRGWAYILWKNSPYAYSYNDYLYGSSGQDNADYALAWSLHSTGRPAGVIVWKGKHAILAVGYQASDTLPNGGTLRGFYLWDPWNGSGFSSSTWLGGISPNSYYTLAWFNGRDSSNRLIFSQNIESPTPGETYWVGSYVLVLRSSATGAQPKDNPPAEYGVPNQYWPSAGSLAPAASLGSTPPIAASLEDALVQGFKADDLVPGNQLGLDLAAVTIGRTIDVSPAAQGINPYVLAEVVSHGNVIAVALLDETDSGYRFGGLTPVSSGARLPSVGDVLSTAASLGASATSATARWAPSDDSPSPFFPIWQVSVGGSQRFLTPAGALLAALPMYSGYVSVP